MKVTALIPDQPIHDVERHTQGKNLTESLVIAIKEWLAFKKLMRLNRKIISKPLEFHPDLSASKIRGINRQNDSCRYIGMDRIFQGERVGKFDLNPRDRASAGFGGRVHFC